MRKAAQTLAVAAASALLLAGCGHSGSSNGPKTAGAVKVNFPHLSKPNFKACITSDVGGFNDKSFNQTALAGVTGAVSDFGIKMAKVQSSSDADYVPNINALVKQKCNEVITVGFNLADATLAAAKKYPNVKFAIVDFSYPPGKAPKNLQGLVFNTAQPAFLAGYLAAGMTKSGYVGTFGGMPYPTVTIYMDGFWEGVQYYNKANKKSVKVVGWDETTQKGTFTNSFTSVPAGNTAGSNEIQQGADILFPVAGQSGEGGLQAAKAANDKAIWVDADGCETYPQYCPTLLTSAEKGLQYAVEQSILNAVQGKFTNQPYVGTLQNGGASLAPYHDATIPSSLQKQIAEVRYKLLHNQIKITSKAVNTL